MIVYTLRKLAIHYMSLHTNHSRSNAVQNIQLHKHPTFTDTKHTTDPHFFSNPPHGSPPLSQLGAAESYVPTNYLLLGGDSRGS